MGCGLAFLTKKSFNPANWRNQREVWEARQNAETEKRRISERDAQLKREREEEDLARVVGGEEGGGRKALSFMYDAGKVPGLERKKGGADDNDEKDYNNGKQQNQQDGETSLYERQPGDDDAAAAFRAMLAKGVPSEAEQSDNLQHSMTAGEAALKGDGGEESKKEDDKDFKPDNRTNLEKAVGRGINSGSGLTLAQQMERFPMLKGAPVALEKSKGGDDEKETDATTSLVFKPFGSQIRNVKCLKCGKWGHSKGDRECEAEWNPFNMTSSIPTAVPQPPAKCEPAHTTVVPESEVRQKNSLDEQRDKRDKKRRRKDDRKHRKKKKHKSHHKRRKRSRYYSSDESTSPHSSNDSDSSVSRRHRRKESSRYGSSSRRHEKKRSKHERRRRHRSPSSSVSVTILATICLLPLLLGVSNAFNYLGMSSRKRQQSTTRLFNSEDTRSIEKLATTPPKDALVLLNEAKKLRAEASMLQQQLILEKEERIRKEREKVDSLIDALLFHGSNTDRFGDDSESEAKSKQQLINTEEQVASLLISKRLSYEMVNQMFDRICEQSNRPQSIDSCSPLLSLLLDASCKVDVIERKDNPNKRWNQRVERDLRRKLFALGYGIKIEDVEKEKNGIRSIHGDKDLYH